jgi:hypothetical protein
VTRLLLLETLERVVGPEIHRAVCTATFSASIDAVLIPQSIGDDLELEHTDRPQDELVHERRSEELRCASSLNCTGPSIACSEIAQPCVETARGEARDSRELDRSPSVNVSPTEMVPWL